MFDAEQLFEGTRNLADKALQEAGEAYKQSLSLYTNADSVVVPKVDVDTLVSEAEDVKTEVKLADCSTYLEDQDLSVYGCNGVLRYVKLNNM